MPVEVITNEQFNQIMRGEKTAKDTKPLPPRADKVAENTETRPTPVTREAKVDTAAPLQEGKREPDPGRDDKPTPTPPKQAAEPPVPPIPDPVKEPPRPEPPKAQEKAEPKKPEPPKEAEAIEPQKAQKPKDEPKKTVEAPRLRAFRRARRRRTPEPPKLDQVAKLLEQKRNDDKPAVEAEIRRRAGPESKDRSERNRAAAVARIRATARVDRSGDQPARVAWNRDRERAENVALHLGCARWIDAGPIQAMLVLSRHEPDQPLHPADQGRVHEGRVARGRAILDNRPSDPSLTSLAESAMRAVRRCNPLKIPAQYQPYYEQWRSRVLRFDPEEMQG